MQRERQERGGQRPDHMGLDSKCSSVMGGGEGVTKIKMSCLSMEKRVTGQEQRWGAWEGVSKW